MAPFADGTPQAAQWPIPPGHFFDYEIVTESDDAGSYFYHSHVQMQAMSCSGALIVEDCGEAPFKYDDERILMFQDYFSKSSTDLASEVTGAPFQWPGNTNGILLNGIGIASGQTSVASKADFAASPGGSRTRYGAHPAHHLHTRDTCNLPVIDIDPGKTYRFRFIGGTGLSFVATAFEGHDNLTIVQVDGNEYNQPASTGHIQMGAGQRFDVLFQAKTTQQLQADGNKTTYFIQFEALGAPNTTRGYAALRYSQDAEIPAAPANPVVDIPTDAPQEWMEYNFAPLDASKNDFPSADEVTRRVVINATEVKLASGKIEIQFNGLSWTEFTYQSPFLVDIYKRGQAAIPNYDAATKNGGWDPNTLSFPAKLNEVIEIVWQNTGSGADNGALQTHPFHAHAKHYFDIGSGKGVYDADTNNAKIAQLGYKPVRRDTTMLFAWDQTITPGEVASWRAWRVRMSDAGVWMVHCHILAHMMMGMQSVWVVGNASDIMQVPLAESQSYLTYGGSVYGNNTHNPSYFKWSGTGTDQCEPIKR